MDREQIIKAVLAELDKMNIPDKQVVPNCGATCIGCLKCTEKNPTGVNAVIDAGATRISSVLGTKPSTSDIAKYIDHTLLKPEGTRDEITKLCEEARQYKFASVCVNPCWIPLCSDMLKGTGVDVCTVIGFPLGANKIETKVFEAQRAIADGATELDMVINIGALKSNMLQYVRDDISSIVNVAKGKAIVKVIIETALLTKEEKVKASYIAKVAGADFVKTSTGFSKSGATAEDIALMRQVVGPDMGVKASGGIRDSQQLLQMISSGATRIGASASVKILKELSA